MMFKVGDRVVCRGYEYSTGKQDLFGTVCEIDGEQIYCNDWSIGDKYGWLHEKELELIEEKPMFDINKPLQTRDGREVRILCTDGPGEWPIVGFMARNNEPRRWNNLGESEDANVFDLINTPPKPIDLGWYPIYLEDISDEFRFLGSAFDTKENAINRGETGVHSDVYSGVRHLSFVNGKVVDDTEEIDK